MADRRRGGLPPHPALPDVAPGGRRRRPAEQRLPGGPEARRGGPADRGRPARHADLTDRGPADRAPADPVPAGRRPRPAYPTVTSARPTVTTLLPKDQRD